MKSEGRWLIHEILQRGMTSIEEFAVDAGVEAQRVAQWVLGRDVPTASEAIALSRYLDIPVLSLRTMAGSKEAA